MFCSLVILLLLSKGLQAKHSLLGCCLATQILFFTTCFFNQSYTVFRLTEIRLLSTIDLLSTYFKVKQKLKEINAFKEEKTHLYLLQYTFHCELAHDLFLCCIPKRISRLHLTIQLKQSWDHDLMAFRH